MIAPTRTALAALAFACLAAAPLSAAFVLENFTLDTGRHDGNRIASPVWDASGLEQVAIERFAWKPDADYLVVRRLTMRGPQYTPAPGLDLAAHLSIALQTEGSALGLRMSAPGGAGWTVSGSVEDLWVETRPVMLGPIAFYGYLDVAVSVRRGSEEPRQARYRFHNMYARYNAGMGLQDEAGEVLAQFLVDSAQELLARVNRDFLHAPPHPSIRLEAETLAASATVRSEAQLRRIGLSGAPEAVAPLLALLPNEPEESWRVHVIDALANLGSPDAVEPLAARYAGEDEDCRFFILKAWDAIGGEAARTLIASRGTNDEDVACRALAARLSR
jgi:hypothetical protein